jgi:hypothetical protein
MQLALIPPPSMSYYMLETNYQLLLPSYKGKGSYDECVRIARDLGNFMIMDNGAAEGHCLERKELYDMADYFGAQEVVVPDVYGEMEPTWEIASNWEHSGHFRHMAVVAAKSTAEACDLIDRYSELSYIDTIGLPRLLVENGVSRSYLTGYAPQDRFEIHWLGASRNFALWEHFSFHAMRDHIRGWDTAKPFAYAWKALDLETYWDTAVSAVPDEAHWSPNSPEDEAARLNIDYLKAICYGE